MDVRLRGGVLALAAALAAGGARAQALPEGVTPQMLAEGRKLFEGRGLCIACHGQKAGGGVGPNLTDADWWHSDGTYPAIVQQILDGVPMGRSRSGTPMPPKGGSSMSEPEVRAVAAYVHSLRLVANVRAEGTSSDPRSGLAGGQQPRPGPAAGHRHRGAPGGAGCPMHGAGHDGTAHGGNGPCRT